MKAKSRVETLSRLHPSRSGAARRPRRHRHFVDAPTGSRSGSVASSGKLAARLMFAFAIAAGKCKRNPAAGLSRALAPKKKTIHFPAITDPQKFGELLRTMDGYQGTFTVCCALRLAPLFAVRPGELRKAKWAEFDLHNAEWRFVASKTHPDHIVPFSRQALAILWKLHQLTGTGQYVFPSARSARARPSWRG